MAKLLTKNGKLVTRGGKLVVTTNPAACVCCGPVTPDCNTCALTGATVAITTPLPGPNSCNQYTGENTFPLVAFPGYWNTIFGATFPDFADGSSIELVIDRCDPATKKWKVSLKIILGCKTPEGLMTGTIAYEVQTELECGGTWRGDFNGGGSGWIKLWRPTRNPLP